MEGGDRLHAALVAGPVAVVYGARPWYFDRMRALPVVLAAAPLLVGAQCNPLCWVGDYEQQPVVELVWSSGGAWQPLGEDQPVPMVVPGQGGRVLLLGVRAKNVDACALQLSMSVHDQCTAADGNDGRIVGREGRPIGLRGRADGWAVPSTDDDAFDVYANVPTCPNLASSRDFDGHPYLVRARVEDQSTGRTAEASGSVVPTCDDVWCECECDADAVLGAGCDGETSPDDGADPAPGDCPVDEE